MAQEQEVGCGLLNSPSGEFKCMFNLLTGSSRQNKTIHNVRWVRSFH